MTDLENLIARARRNERWKTRAQSMGIALALLGIAGGVITIDGYRNRGMYQATVSFVPYGQPSMQQAAYEPAPVDSFPWVHKGKINNRRPIALDVPPAPTQDY